MQLTGVLRHRSSSAVLSDFWKSKFCLYSCLCQGVCSFLRIGVARSSQGKLLSWLDRVHNFPYNPSPGSGVHLPLTKLPEILPRQIARRRVGLLVPSGQAKGSAAVLSKRWLPQRSSPSD